MDEHSDLTYFRQCEARERAAAAAATLPCARELHRVMADRYADLAAELEIWARIDRMEWWLDEACTPPQLRVVPPSGPSVASLRST